MRSSCFGFGRSVACGGRWFVVVEIQNVLLEVPDPVLLHGEGAVELHIAEPALEGVNFTHKFDEGGGGWLWHEGRYGTATRGFRGAALFLPSISMRRVFERPSLDAPWHSDVKFTPCYLDVWKCAVGVMSPALCTDPMPGQGSRSNFHVCCL